MSSDVLICERDSVSLKVYFNGSNLVAELIDSASINALPITVKTDVSATQDGFAGDSLVITQEGNIATVVRTDLLDSVPT